MVSDSLLSHGLQRTRPPCPSLSPRVCSNSVHWVSDAIQPSLLLPSPLPSIFPSIRVFSKELFLCIKWPKYWSFSFSISPSNEYSLDLIFFRIDWVWSSCCPTDSQESSPASELTWLKKNSLIISSRLLISFKIISIYDPSRVDFSIGVRYGTNLIFSQWLHSCPSNITE